MEGAECIKSGELLKFSEQQLVDCDTSSHGCSGGSKTGAFVYYEIHKPMSEAEYPYTARDGTC